MSDTGEICAETLREVLKHGGRIDASSLVLGSAEARVRMSDSRWGAHLAANLMAAYEYEPYGAWARKVQAAADRHDRRVRAGDLPAEDRFDPTSLGLGLRDFEALSLAARAALAIHESQNSSVSVPMARGHHQLLRDRAREAGLNLEGFRVVYAEDILKALAWAADEVGPDQGRGGSALTQQQLAMRSGLQLVGCWIRGRSNDGVRLINARLPFSLRLIGCVVECPVLLAHCELVTLDLSGSALTSLDAGGLRASGSIHLRRTTFRTPVSFAGAHVAGTLNASDAVISPFQSQPKQIAIDSDHGMLNLSKATIENEVRLERTRIWGGLSLRGAQVGRSIHMNDALVISPLGLLEKWFAETVKYLEVPGLERHASMRIAEIDVSLSRKLHGGEGAEAQAHAPDARVEMEVLWGDPRLWRHLVERTLIHLKPRAVISAIRADGLIVGGTFFARGLITNGRTRIKYARIGGSLRLEGALLRSASACRRSVDALLTAWTDKKGGGPVLEDRRKNWDTLIDHLEARSGWSSESPEVALDLRGTELKGDLALQCDKEGRGLQADIERATRRGPVIPREKTIPTHIQGNILMQGLKAEGSVRMRGVVIEAEEPWPSVRRRRGATLPQTTASPPIAPYDPLAMLRLLLEGARFWVASRLNGLGRRARAFLKRPTAEREWFPGEARQNPAWIRQRDAALQRAGKVWSILMENAAIGRDVDLRMTHGLFGADLQNCTIGGDLTLSDKSSGRMRRDMDLPGFIHCADRARNVGGTLCLRGIEIGGDAMLTFDPAVGPIIKADMATVGGRLDIYPQPGAQSYQLRDDPEREKDLAAIRRREKARSGDVVEGFWLDQCPHLDLKDTRGAAPVGRSCRTCGLLVEKAEDHMAWYIDLRHARATVFGHPPAAWPDPGALSLDGFAYQQTSDLGPLAPQPPFEASREARWRRSRTQYVWRRKPLLRLALGTVLWLLALGVWVGGGAALLWWAADRLAGPAYVLSPSLSYLTAAFVMGLLLSLLMFTPPGLRLWPFLRNDNVAPRALEYLRRQRVTGNRFKWRPASYHVLDTYVRAAKSLREAGRYISANLVEEDRLRRRTEMLSWRLHGPVKLAMRLVDLFSGYGFKLSRAFAWMGCLIFGVAILAHSAAAFGYLERTPRLQVVDSELVEDPPSRPACDQARGTNHSVLELDCPGLLYAADLVLPFIDLGEAERWRPALGPAALDGANGKGRTRLDHLGEPLRSLTASLILSWPDLTELLGLLFTAIMGAAAAVRIESALARVEE